MKEDIFKQTFETYTCDLYHGSSPIGADVQKSIKVNKNDDFEGESITHILESPTKKYPLFLIKKTTTDEKSFLQNYGNPLCRVVKTHAMVVITKTEDKVALKLFYGFRSRAAGKPWFKVSHNVNYISVNIRTGDVYHGYIQEYQKKKKCRKRIRRNTFFDNPINIMKSNIKNVLNGFVNNETGYNITMDVISKFMFEVDGRNNFIEDLDFNQRLFKFYLDKRKIKYPNNFQVYSQHLVGPKIRKIMKKNGNKLVDAFMEVQHLSGKKLKKSLHDCHGLNISLYQLARDLFGDDWLNQDEDVITKLLNSIVTTSSNIMSEFKSVISVEELRRVYRIFKLVYIDEKLDSWTFHDHIRMYAELKLYGETDIRWMSENHDWDFRQEHLDWTDKIQFYKQGFYSREYPQYFIDKIQNKIGEYQPVLLTNSDEYNEESSVQSNCVKTYVTRPSSFIISLRKGYYGDRATIEYSLTKVNDNIEVGRVQSLGRFNGKLGEEWDDILFKLDEVILSSVKDERFETVKIVKKCKNGVIFSSDSYFDHGNKLRWTHKSIDSGPRDIWA